MAFLMQDPDVEYVLNVTGSSPRVGSNQARSQLTVILKSWKERESEDISEVMKRVRDELSRYPESKGLPLDAARHSGTGRLGRVRNGARSPRGCRLCRSAAGGGYVDALCRAAARVYGWGWPLRCKPTFRSFISTWTATKRSWSGFRCPISFSTMKAFTGSIYVNDFNMFNRIYRVYIQADAPYRAYRDNLNLFFVRGADGR